MNLLNIQLILLSDLLTLSDEEIFSAIEKSKIQEKED